jgi:hypothetical protein
MMQAQLEYENMGNYLRVSAFGVVSIEAGKSLVDSIWRETARQKLNRVLLLAWEMVPESREFYNFILGVRMGQVWSEAIKVAGVRGTNLYGKILENAAVSSGARFKIFSDEKLALKWLLQDT